MINWKTDAVSSFKFTRFAIGKTVSQSNLFLLNDEMK